jgi:putative SOS response-associated peptidase YedK
MCGRFTLRSPASIIAEQFSVFEVPELHARFNIAPTQSVPVVRQVDTRMLSMLRWGLVPSWAKDISIGNSLTNARAETVASKPSFRAAFRKRRCLIVADGFYEWQRTEKQKQPYYIHRRDDRPFAMAGLWESWNGGEGMMDTCTIVTTEANDLMRPIHDRMPVILARDDYETWLHVNQEGGDEVLGLLKPYEARRDEDEMEAFTISTRVNSTRNNGAELIERITPAPSERSLFD